jgi:hypothetical protein
VDQFCGLLVHQTSRVWTVGDHSVGVDSSDFQLVIDFFRLYGNILGTLSTAMFSGHEYYVADPGGRAA